MASNVEISGNLTKYQYVRLGQSISGNNMESIALGYLNIDQEKIKQIREVRLQNPEGFVRDVIKEWACRNPDNQVQVRIRSILIISVMASVADRRGRVAKGAMPPHPPPPGSVKISHKKDGHQRQPHRFHVYRSPLPGRWIRQWAH